MTWRTASCSVNTRATRAARVRSGWFFTAAVEQGRSRAACSSPPPPCFFSRPVRRSACAAPSLHPCTRAPARGGRTTCGRADARRAQRDARGGARGESAGNPLSFVVAGRGPLAGCISGLVALLPSALRKRHSARHRPHRRATTVVQSCDRRRDCYLVARVAAAASDGGEGRPRGQSALAAVTAPRPRLARPNRRRSDGRVGLRLGGDSWLLESLPRLSSHGSFLFRLKPNLARARVCVASGPL